MTTTATVAKPVKAVKAVKVAKVPKAPRVAKPAKPKKTTIKLLSYSDAQHGWLRVPHKMLAKLGIAAQITPFSYMRTEYAYLEEDHDMTTFMLAMDRAGKKVEFVNRNTDRVSRIRNYPSYVDQSPVVTPVVAAVPVVATEQE
jgi:hypothetical protein